MFALLRELSSSTRVSGASNANFSSSDNLEFLTKLELQISSPRKFSIGLGGRFTSSTGILYNFSKKLAMYSPRSCSVLKAAPVSSLMLSRLPLFLFLAKLRKI